MNKVFLIVMTVGFHIASGCYAFTEKIKQTMQDPQGEIIFAGNPQEGIPSITVEDINEQDTLTLSQRFVILQDELQMYALISKMTQQELNIQDEYGRTLLMTAIEKGKGRVALALVKAMNKEGLLLEDNQEMSALTYAGFYRMEKVVDAILEKIGL